MQHEWHPGAIARPLDRSPLRLRLGKEWHILRRRLRWLRGKERWARNCHPEMLPHLIFEHRTPLLRGLPKVDMVYQYNKITNLGIAAPRIDGIEIAPGETFSFWRLVGRPRASRGFKTGFALQQGRVVGSMGGGLCQLTNLLFWMTLHSPLTVTERWRHSYDVFPDTGRSQPFGSGATCSYNYLDLCIRNDQHVPFRIHAWLDDTHLNGAITSAERPLHRYRVRESDHLIRREFWGGHSRHNRLVRETYTADGAELLDESVVVENHALMMYAPILPEARPSPSAEFATFG